MVLTSKFEGNGSLTWINKNNTIGNTGNLTFNNVNIENTGDYILKANYKSCENSDTVSVEILKILGNTIEESGLVKIFPNPSSDLFTMELEIYCQTGKL